MQISTTNLHSSLSVAFMLLIMPVGLVSYETVLAAEASSSSSVELGLLELSPKGEAGGYAMPASGCSTLHRKCTAGKWENNKVGGTYLCTAYEDYRHSCTLTASIENRKKVSTWSTYSGDDRDMKNGNAIQVRWRSDTVDGSDEDLISCTASGFTLTDGADRSIGDAPGRKDIGVVEPATSDSTTYSVSCSLHGYTASDSVTINNTSPLPINGSCGSSANTCSAGTRDWSPTDSSTQYLWTCVGQHGGSNASCSLNKPINGSCGSSANTCSAGTRDWSPTDSSTQYLWTCVGQHGGSNASCSATKQPDLRAGVSGYPQGYASSPAGSRSITGTVSNAGVGASVAPYLNHLYVVNASDNKWLGNIRVDSNQGSLGVGSSRNYAGSYSFAPGYYRVVSWVKHNTTPNTSYPDSNTSNNIISSPNFYVLPALTGLRHTCNTDGTQMTISWDPAGSPTTQYYFRMRNSAWQALSPNADSNTITTTSRTIAVTPGETYTVWVHAARGAAGFYGTHQTLSGISCPAADDDLDPDNPTINSINPSGQRYRYGSSLSLFTTQRNRGAATSDPYRFRFRVVQPVSAVINAGGLFDNRSAVGAGGTAAHSATWLPGETGNFTIQARTEDNNSWTAYSSDTDAVSGNDYSSVLSFQVVPQPVTNFQHSCNPAGDEITFTWSTPPGTVGNQFAWRLNNLSNGWTGTCGSINPGDECQEVTGNSRTVSINQGDSVNVWIHARGNELVYSDAVSLTVSCPIGTIDLEPDDPAKTGGPNDAGTANFEFRTFMHNRGNIDAGAFDYEFEIDFLSDGSVNHRISGSRSGLSANSVIEILGVDSIAMPAGNHRVRVRQTPDIADDIVPSNNDSEWTSFTISEPLIPCSPASTLVGDKGVIREGESVELTMSAASEDIDCTLTGGATNNTYPTMACGTTETVSPEVNTTYQLQCVDGTNEELLINVLPLIQET